MNYLDRKITRPGTTRRTRLVGYDYSQPGYYFVTICTHQRQHVFGQISGDEIELTSPGQMLHEVIATAESKFDSVSIDASVVMPNHLHILVGMSVRIEDGEDREHLSNIVRWFKNVSIRRYSLGVSRYGWKPYREHLWQKGYHDHIVRNERELESLRRYIATNIESWEKDKFHDGNQDW